MARDPEQLAHQEWLGYVQPVGLVVSTPALLAAQAYINKNIIPQHQRFLEWVEPIPVKGSEDTILAVTDLPGLLQDVLGWEVGDLVSDGSLDSLEVVLTEYGQTLRPTYAVKEIEQDDAQATPWQMLIQTLPNGVDLDAMLETDDHKWQASAHAHFERMLRETKVPIGLLFNGTHFRLVYAPRGETSGWLTFPVDAMAQVDGRPIFAGLHLLLYKDRLFTLPRKQRLPYLLAESRKYQNLVSTQLSEQVLHSLYELLRGFQAADDMTHGELLREVLKEEPNHVYAGLLNVLLRLVFVLYAEDRSLMPGDAVYTNFYSVNGLFERLRSDASRFPDTMDQRYGAWTQLLSLFRLIHDGASHGEQFTLPPRHGHLFNPDRYPFLEGRPWQSTRQIHETVQPPMVSDGIVFRVLHNLLILDGERISYRTLDVEQIGSVYQAIMDFTLEVAKGRSIAVKPTKPHGAPLTINLDELLTVKSGNRAKWVKETSEHAVTGESLRALQEAATPEDLVAALGKKVSLTTPGIVPSGAMILQPSGERRRSGSHYTPRSLTEPIVRTTLRPVLEQLGEKPTPDQILALKVCDEAMGSGAFLVETDRQLADELVKAWHKHHCVPTIPHDEDEVLFARRLVAQRCLYGVDKNPLAVDLAKLSLWLVTLAKDHAFTFVDHALRCGDSLVGLTRKQIAAFHWQPDKYYGEIEHLITERVQQAMELRARIQSADEAINETTLRHMLKDSQEALEVVRTIGDLVVAAFFSSEKPKERETARTKFATTVSFWLKQPNAILYQDDIRNTVQVLTDGERNLLPFHWEIEFPEVFWRDNGGFDAIVGNPPFLGGRNITASTGSQYSSLLLALQPGLVGGADLVAHFFRRAFVLLRVGGTFGLIATNTIRQGDTRNSGLRWICENNGIIFQATRRLRWPGQAAVVVCVVHVLKDIRPCPCLLDGRPVGQITAYLFHNGTHADPFRLVANASVAFIGNLLRGMGFSFDDAPISAAASPTSVMQQILNTHPEYKSLIRPFVGGEELNNRPHMVADRRVIDFAGRSLEEARRYPELLAVVEEHVRPERLLVKNSRVRDHWWQFEYWAPDLRERSSNRAFLYAVGCGASPHLAVGILPVDYLPSHTLCVFATDRQSFFCCMQSRIHETWARFFASSMKDDLRYTPTDCFETFPFPKDFEANLALESAGKEYYEFRAALMVSDNGGLTKTYNRFHDPEEHSPDILRLRELHGLMDRAVLDAYGWTDLHPTCEFLLDYEEEEDEDETPTKGRGRKKPWRYRWPDDLRDEVLARLLELNRQYAEAERLSGVAAEKKTKRADNRNEKKQVTKRHEELQVQLNLDEHE